MGIFDPQWELSIWISVIKVSQVVQSPTRFPYLEKWPQLLKFLEKSWNWTLGDVGISAFGEMRCLSCCKKLKNSPNIWIISCSCSVLRRLRDNGVTLLSLVSPTAVRCCVIRNLYCYICRKKWMVLWLVLEEIWIFLWGKLFFKQTQPPVIYCRLN